MSQRSSENAIREVLTFLLRHWWREKWFVAWVAGCMLSATAADLLMPVYSGHLVDALAAHPVSRAMALMAAIRAIAMMAFLGVSLALLRYAGMAGIIRLTLRLMSRFAGQAFWRVQRFSTDWHANNFAGAIVRRITRGMWAVDMMDDILLLDLLPALVVLVGSSLLLGWHWPIMGALVGAGAVAYITISILLSLYYVSPASRLSNAQDTRIGAAMADSITCNTVVKSFGAERREDVRLGRVLDKWHRRTARSWTFATRNGAAQQLLLQVLRAVVLACAVWLWWKGRATAGDLTFVLTSYFIVHGYLRDIGQHVRNLQRSANDMEEMVQFYARPLGIEDRPGAVPIRVREGEIVYDHVTFRYAGQTDALFEDFSLRIRSGERIGLVGHSGSGKTTFVKLLHRLYDADSGSILVDGQDISHGVQESLRAQIALVPQEPILFHRTLAENIAYGRPNAPMHEIEAAARLANAHDFIVRQPKGYQTLVGERGVKLSGGERQRVALARAFLANTPVLVLDEATSSLDSESEALIQEAMERLMAGRTSIVIAHRLSTVRMLDRILVFERGRIIEEGTHEELVRRIGGTYQRLFERQALGLVVDGIDEEETGFNDEALAYE
ncbi:ABC transporter ATP-binding protein [Silvibacterium dinghuense]|uniref:ABC transporter ATP-binding protein n=1 Tax=Silvibacterium dinghuense TaxID=1560006 RepID=A0A4Q1SGN6_9BACT|nr:ABC transporter ATP-binding protein [Silvibacterium dinghuense]RXS96674.1 ABC transporter ATP-binding protein [Silvibacterium dinghuense]GGG92731.1 multidrug ABC transporter ATP-binding protein [Silvibacterium dinghuense]